MRQKLVNIIELAHVVDILDSFVPKHVVESALRTAGLDRKMLSEGTGFVSYAAEAVILESVARAIGDRHLGARVGQAFDYLAYGAYANYVLGAPDLGSALDRGRRALSLTHPGSEIVFRQTDTHVVVGRDSKGMSVVGHRHLDEGALFVISKVVRYFLGADWRPDWFELPDGSSDDTLMLADILGAPVRTGVQSPSVAIRLSDLATRNPQTMQMQKTIPLEELGALMGVEPVQSMKGMVLQIMRAHFPTNVPSERSVAAHIGIGSRSLQRALRAEGTAYRKIRSKFIEEQAREMLQKSDIPVERIAEMLGYKEPKSFRRAFREWTGSSPKSFRGNLSANT
ncbi:AraC family transcriptional regulator [Ruegeria sp. PrR005]|uniref:AraC family transcriptional regulator n=1 Tax=Ruegeria sp. PrR005 TaxID=2706882 RepID=A0A6B2NPI1_9RHOB|nr:AraC family transcriptional regulator [Ruegeria sp. PrR005]NDW46012.1 AraC family transcriptional regulator [Ruegeria sp. PrR005]